MIITTKAAAQTKEFSAQTLGAVSPPTEKAAVQGSFSPGKSSNSRPIVLSYEKTHYIEIQGENKDLLKFKAERMTLPVSSRGTIYVIAGQIQKPKKGLTASEAMSSGVSSVDTAVWVAGIDGGGIASLASSSGASVFATTAAAATLATIVASFGLLVVVAGIAYLGNRKYQMHEVNKKRPYFFRLGIAPFLNPGEKFIAYESRAFGGAAQAQVAPINRILTPKLMEAL